MATDIFAKIGDIKGESIDARHPDEIDIVSFAWGVTHTPPTAGGGGGGTGKAVFQALSLVHTIDRATPALLLACATGRRMRDATITHRRTGEATKEFLVIKLTDVAITGVAHTGDTESPYSEVITLTFNKVDFEYRPIRPDGSLGEGSSFKFDLRTGQAG
jgi:type VI secretion system secreted protein Hcp